MANTVREYKGNGFATTYAVDFTLGYIDRSHVYVYLDGDHYTKQIPYTYVNGTTIQVDLGNNVKFVVRRVVPRSVPINDYEDGALLHESNLDASFAQTLMILEEVQDGYSDPSSNAILFNNNVDMTQHRITNLANPVNDGDAISFLFMQQYILDESRGVSLVERAEAAAKIAEACAAKAGVTLDSFTKFYMGDLDYLPAVGKANGSLVYYRGTQFSQGLYIYFPEYREKLTINWRLVSGVGPQGPQGAEGVQGPIGATGKQGIEGPKGIQGQTGIQGALGDQGPQGVKGEFGTQGNRGVQGVVGPLGPTGPQGLQGLQGVQGLIGVQGPLGPEGPTGSSYLVNKTGILADRAGYDFEPEGFSYLATDAFVSGNEDPKFDRFVTDGVRTKFNLTFLPDGPQSLEVSVGGVNQGPDNYIIDYVARPDESYTLRIEPALRAGLKIVVREYSISTGYGALFIKKSAAEKDWSAGVAFGKGPRGDTGPQGPVGYQGPQGIQGQQGVKGPLGDQGPIGIVGPEGREGALGPRGQQGPEGLRGPTGVQGKEGPAGPQGIQGPQGNKGVDGPQGPQGKVGEDGKEGLQGKSGPTGLPGPQGGIGLPGDKGARGSSAFFQTTAATSFNAASANQLIVNAGYQTARYDQVTQYNVTAQYTETRQYIAGGVTTLSSWELLHQVIDGVPKVVGGIAVPAPQYPTFPINDRRSASYKGRGAFGGYSGAAVLYFNGDGTYSIGGAPTDPSIPTHVLGNYLGVLATRNPADYNIRVSQVQLYVSPTTPMATSVISQQTAFVRLGGTVTLLHVSVGGLSSQTPAETSYSVDIQDRATGKIISETRMGFL